MKDLQQQKQQNKSIYQSIKKLVRPRIDYLPKDIIEQIKLLEKQFTKYQELLKAQQDYDMSNEPILYIPPITEAYIKINNPDLTPAERSSMMLEVGFDFPLQ